MEKSAYLTEVKRSYTGLLPYVQKFCEDRKTLTSMSDVDSENLTLPKVDTQEIEDWLGTQSLPFTPKYYQTYGLHYNHKTPKGSLSLVNYREWEVISHLPHVNWFDVKTLIVVPTISLVTQMYKDLLGYG